MNCTEERTIKFLRDAIETLQKNCNKVGYKTKCPDTISFYVPQTKHKLNKILGYLLLAPTGEEVVAAFEVAPNFDVTIDSNLSLLNYTLILH